MRPQTWCAARPGPTGSHGCRSENCHRVVTAFPCVCVFSLPSTAFPRVSTALRCLSLCVFSLPSTAIPRVFRRRPRVHETATACQNRFVNSRPSGRTGGSPRPVRTRPLFFSLPFPCGVTAFPCAVTAILSTIHCLSLPFPAVSLRFTASSCGFTAFLCLKTSATAPKQISPQPPRPP